MKSKSPVKSSAQPRGRPRAFDTDAALDKALGVFWKHGYEGASLPELTAAMGISRPSLYAAFGNKEQLFRRSVGRYSKMVGKIVDSALALPTARAAVETLLRQGIAQPCKSSPRGCLLVQAALVCSESSQSIRKELAKLRNANELLLRQRLQRALADGDLPAGSSPAALAKYIATLQHGLAVQLAGGATPQDLLAAVDIAMQAWPMSA